MNKNTRKLFRLQTSEGYKVNKVDKLNDKCFEVFTRDYKLKAFVDISGTIILSSDKNYNKIDFYKIRNFSNLLAHCHFGLKLKKERLI